MEGEKLEKANNVNEKLKRLKRLRSNTDGKRDDSLSINGEFCYCTDFKAVQLKRTIRLLFFAELDQQIRLLQDEFDSI